MRCAERFHRSLADQTINEEDSWLREVGVDAEERLDTSKVRHSLAESYEFYDGGAAFAEFQFAQPQPRRHSTSDVHLSESLWHVEMLLSRLMRACSP